MSALEAVARADLPLMALGRVAPKVQEVGFPEAEPLSVFLGDGVVPRSAREDNFNQLGADLGKYQRVLPGDVVFNKLRTWQGGFGVSSFEGIVSPAYIVVRPDPRIIEPRWLHHVLRSHAYLAELTRLSKWMPPSQFDIAWDDLRSLPLWVPTLEEQRRIADFLDNQVARIDALVGSRERESALVLSSVESAAYAAVTGGAVTMRRRSSLPWSSTLPSEWGEPRICQVARMGTGHTPSRSEPEYWKDCTIPWLTTTDVHRFRKDEIDQVDDTELHLSTEGLANSAAVLHPAGTVALSRTASPGFSIIMGSDMATSQDYATWTCGPRLLPEFLLWCLRAMRRDLLGRLATGSTHKTIYFPELMSIRVPLPSLEEQLDAVSRIRESVQQSRSAVALIAASVDLLQEFKRSLISAAVSGEFEVSSASGRGVPA